jgi:serine protease AprX
VGQGPTSDGRVKPDLVGPTNYETADGSSSTAMSIFTGTSGATAVSGGTGAALWSFLRGSNATVDPGFVHAGMISGGSHPYPFDDTEGAGKFKLPAGGIYIPFTATVHDGEQINLPFNLAATGCRLSVSLWWPESLNSDHNDVDLHIFHPSGTTWRRATAPTASGSSPGSPVGSSVAPGSSR